MANPFLRLFGMAQELVRGQDATAAALRRPAAIEVEAALTTSPADFAHKLGRRPQGFTIVSNPSGLSVIEGTSTNPELFLRLSCSSGSGTIRVQVF